MALFQQDVFIVPDLSTLTRLPWLPGCARVIGDVQYASGEPVDFTSRFIARRASEKLAEIGLHVKSGFEYEHVILDAKTKEKVMPAQKDCFETRSNVFDYGYVRDLFRYLPAVGVEVTDSHTEYGSSQYEMKFAPGWGLGGPDAAFSYRTYSKEIAKMHGYLLTFMARPFSDHTRNACHLHQSLWKTTSDGQYVNALCDESGSKMSELGRYWLGGLLNHAPALAAIAMPTVNCIKIMEGAAFHATKPTFGFEDRIAMVRVKGTSASSYRFESRIGSALSNVRCVWSAGDIDIFTAAFALCCAYCCWFRWHQAAHRAASCTRSSRRQVVSAKPRRRPPAIRGGRCHA